MLEYINIKNILIKVFISKWTNEIFIIKKVLNTKPITYRIMDQYN